MSSISVRDIPSKQVILYPNLTNKVQGLGLRLTGGRNIGNSHNTVGAFVTSVEKGTIAEQLLGELKIGDEILEWNGECLRNQPDAFVQTLLSRWPEDQEEIELTIRLDGQTLGTHEKHFRRNSRSPSRASYNSLASVKEGGFESPNSDKSWTKEFGDGRNTITSRKVKPKSVETDRILAVPREELPSNDLFLKIPVGSLNNGQANKSEMQHENEYGREESDSHEVVVVHQARSPPIVNTHNTKSNGIIYGEDKERYSQKVQRVNEPELQVFHRNNLEMSNQQSVNPAQMSSRRNPPPMPKKRRLRKKNSQRLKNCGEVEAMFMYDYKQNELVIRVERAVGLALPERDRLTPFIKIHFIKNNTVRGKRCTKYLENTNNPRWEQSFTYSIDDEDLPNYQIRLSAWDYDDLTHCIFIGTSVIDLGADWHIDGNLRMYKLDSKPSDQRHHTVTAPPRRSLTQHHSYDQPSKIIYGDNNKHNVISDHWQSEARLINMDEQDGSNPSHFYGEDDEAYCPSYDEYPPTSSQTNGAWIPQTGFDHNGVTERYGHLEDYTMSEHYRRDDGYQYQDDRRTNDQSIS